MKKNILVIITDKTSSVTFHRFVTTYAQKEIQDEYNISVTQSNELDWSQTEKIAELFQIIHIHQTVADNIINFQISKLKKLGVKIVVDADDYQTAPKSNPFSKVYNQRTVYMYELLKLADLITCSTATLKNEIKKRIGKCNIEVWKNTTSYLLKKNLKEITSNKLRVGVIGGISHYEDIKSIEYLFKNNPLNNKITWVLGGYSNANENTKLIWDKIENIITDNGNNTNYIRLNTLPVDEYMTLFNQIDVVVQPLEKSLFNECKSELRLVESATANKMLIVSPTDTFKKYEDACYIAKTKTDWQQALESIINKDEKFQQKKLKNKQLIENELNIETHITKRIMQLNNLIK